MFEKKVTTELIEQYLEKMGLPHKGVDEPGEQEGVVISALPVASGEQYLLAVDPIIERDLLRLRVGKILEAPLDATPADRLTGLLLAMTALNYRIPIGGFGFDPNDGEVVLSAGLPINSNDLKFEDFQHAILMLGVVLNLHAADLKAVADGTKQAEDILS